MNKKTFFLVCLCVVFASVAVTAGTLAYLTDEDAAVNTFTVGRVDIKVDETAVDEAGVPLARAAQRVQSNEYHLLPGCSYTKDPAVTLQPGSEEAYIRMLLTVHNASAVQAVLDKYALGDFSSLIGGWDPQVWVYEGFQADDAANTITFEFRYHTKAAAGDAPVMLPPLFDTLLVPGDMTGQELQQLYEGGFKMEVFGHAIQAAGFDTAQKAWEAFDRQMTP